MWKQFLNDYFNFTSKERKGIIFIVALILFLIFLPLLFPLLGKQELYSHNEFKDQIDQLTFEKTDSTKFTTYPKYPGKGSYGDYAVSKEKNYQPLKAEVFYFDPNTTSAGDWKRLGVTDKTVHTIQNYLSKGGKFYKPEDMGKIWGISPADVQRLIPYVSIKKISGAYTSFPNNAYQKSPASYGAKIIQPIDINLADSSAYIGLPGIGSKLAQRIIAFREKLGGFYTVDQVGETYLLPDSTFQKIKSSLVISGNPVRKININAASVDEMKAHPYLRYNVANAIFQYRQQHGNFSSVEEIKKIMLVTEDIYSRVIPYLSIQ
ncbi:MAG: helix-hairpin-helix domain-containing protein [Ginsengibacter sp.]